MITVVTDSGAKKEFRCTASEVASLPTTGILVGSIALCYDTGDVYEFEPDGSWHKL